LRFILQKALRMELNLKNDELSFLHETIIKKELLAIEFSA
jgi:hypothetical protein